MNQKRIERFILSFFIVGAITCLTYLGSVIPPAHGIGETDLGRIVTSVGSVDYGGFQALTPNSTTASSLTPSPTNAEKAFMTLETASVRFRVDGVAPTTTVGHLLTSGQNLTLNNKHQITNFKVISVSTHGALKISYGR